MCAKVQPHGWPIIACQSVLPSHTTKWLPHHHDASGSRASAGRGRSCARGVPLLPPRPGRRGAACAPGFPGWTYPPRRWRERRQSMPRLRLGPRGKPGRRNNAAVERPRDSRGRPIATDPAGVAPVTPGTSPEVPVTSPVIHGTSLKCPGPPQEPGEPCWLVDIVKLCLF